MKKGSRDVLIYGNLALFFYITFVIISIFVYFAKYPWDINNLWKGLDILSPMFSLFFSIESFLKEKRTLITWVIAILSILTIMLFIFCIISGNKIPTYYYR